MDLEEAKTSWRDFIVKTWNLEVDTPTRDYLHRKYGTLEEAIEKEDKNYEERWLREEEARKKPVSFSKEAKMSLRRMGLDPEQCREVLKKPKTIEETLAEIKRNQPSEEEFKFHIQETNRKLVAKMLEKGVLACPKCGRGTLRWICCDLSITGENEGE